MTNETMTPRDRADRAQTATLPYLEGRNPVQAVVELLEDLSHLCDHIGLDFGMACTMAATGRARCMRDIKAPVGPRAEMLDAIRAAEARVCGLEGRLADAERARVAAIHLENGAEQDLIDANMKLDALKKRLADWDAPASDEPTDEDLEDAGLAGGA